MDPSRWGKIKKIFNRVLDLCGDELESVLAVTCASDADLRREIESLLAAHKDAGKFLDEDAIIVLTDERFQPLRLLHAPTVKVAPREIVAENLISAATEIQSAAPNLIGRELANYKIIAFLGKGGMGEVYLAQDIMLRRKIALKILPARFTADQDRLKRFVQEAQSASSLNHPNIITIYEIGHVNEVHFIATEFIDGRTLRQLITDSRLTLRDALEIVTQIAGALAAAHAAGIIHRDIKPENIMVRPDGLAKVLDFGIAKLTESSPTIIDIPFSIANQKSTRSGILGTPQYMSPEQALGENVDTRTDIFSLGIVLYEMTTGTMPFGGETIGDVIAALLRSEPLPPSHYLPEVPRELERIIEKALVKDRRLRYQTIKDLQLDLKNFKENLEFEARLIGEGQLPAHRMVVQEATRQNPEVSQAQTASALPGAIKRRRRDVLLILTALAIVAFGLAFGWRRRIESFKTPNINRVPNTGKAVCSAISPDGKDIVYALNDAQKQTLWIRRVNDMNSSRQIVPPAPVEYQGITFSRDGGYLYYVVRFERAGGVLYRIRPAEVGVAPPQTLLDNVDSPVAVSPDGKQIAFTRFDYPAGNGSLMVAQEDGASVRTLSVRNNMNTYRRTGPSWSPDGKLIACAVVNSVGAYQSVVGVNVESGATIPLTSQRWAAVGQVAWLSDGSGLLVAAGADSRLMQLWYISYPGGATRRLTNDLSTYTNISLTADSEIFTTIRTEQFMNIWVAPGGDAGRAIQITTGGLDGIRGLVWTHDDRIVYRTFANGSPNLWMMNADGSGNRQISNDAYQNLDPTVTPDGRHIAWSSSPGENRNIWRMGLDGGSPEQLTNGSGEWFPQFTPDGKWMVYQAKGTREIKRVLKKVSLAGGDPVQLTDKAAFAPALSPDGKLIAFNYRPERGAPNKIAVISIDGGPPIRVFEITGDDDRIIHWMPDGKALAFAVTKGGVSNIWIQPLAGGPLQQLTHFTSHQIINFAWSRDGRQLALSRSSLEYSEVTLISNFR